MNWYSSTFYFYIYIFSLFNSLFQALLNSRLMINCFSAFVCACFSSEEIFVFLIVTQKGVFKLQCMTAAYYLNQDTTSLSVPLSVPAYLCLSHCFCLPLFLFYFLSYHKMKIGCLFSTCAFGLLYFASLCPLFSIHIASHLRQTITYPQSIQTC